MQNWRVSRPFVPTSQIQRDHGGHFLCSMAICQTGKIYELRLTKSRFKPSGLSYTQSVTKGLENCALFSVCTPDCHLSLADNEEQSLNNFSKRWSTNHRCLTKYDPYPLLMGTRNPSRPYFANTIQRGRSVERKSNLIDFMGPVRFCFPAFPLLTIRSSCPRLMSPRRAVALP